MPFDAVDMNVDETRNDEAISDVDDRRALRRSAGNVDRRDPSLVDDERCAGEDAVRQDDVAAGEHDHRASVAARAAPSGPPSSPSVAAVTVSDSAMRLRETAQRFGARRLEQLVRGVRDQAAENHDVRIGDGDEIGDGHADVARRVANNRDRDAVAFARGVEDLLHVNSRRDRRPPSRARAIDRPT